MGSARGRDGGGSHPDTNGALRTILVRHEERMHICTIRAVSFQGYHVSQSITLLSALVRTHLSHLTEIFMVW